MTWLNAMKVDAAAIAFPHLEDLKPEEIQLDFRYDPGSSVGCDTCGWDPYSEATVVARDEYKHYDQWEIGSFMQELMTKGSEAHLV